ncbi:hypothetical protein K2Q08_00770 [Patescibacteria group bacterium]|nr:hypothetical protein [Patescibacteria group bacterium]
MVNKLFIAGEALAVLLIVAAGVYAYNKHLSPQEPVASTDTTVQTPTSAEFDRAVATKAVTAWKQKDAETLASLAHPELGVRFSSSGYVTQSDLVFTSTQLKNFFTDKKVYTWGLADGSGFPIELNPSQYYEQFNYNADYAQAPEVGYNEVLGSGNTTNNAKEFYPDSMIVEYHFDGFDPQYQGIDWTSIRLVFLQENGSWYLVGVIKDNATI